VIDSLDGIEVAEEVPAPHRLLDACHDLLARERPTTPVAFDEKLLRGTDAEFATSTHVSDCIEAIRAHVRRSANLTKGSATCFCTVVTVSKNPTVCIAAETRDDKSPVTFQGFTPTRWRIEQVARWLHGWRPPEQRRFASGRVGR
jgi:hypothetical protein